MTPQRTDGHKNKIVVGMKSLDALLGRKRLRQSSRRFYIECATTELADYSAFLLAEIIMSYLQQFSQRLPDFRSVK